MVKRFHDPGDWMQSPTGEYVRYEDYAKLEAAMNKNWDAEIKQMVNRFLAWRLPQPWNPDNGISYQRPNYAHQPTDSDWPIGTNLFDAAQAESMIRHMLGFTNEPHSFDCPSLESGPCDCSAASGGTES